MHNLNRGYVGASRSVGSYNAICDYEVPISLIDKRLIDEFLAEEGLDEFNEEDFVYLKSLSISKWVFVAKEKTGAKMAKYYVKFSCGHQDCIQLFGKVTERERKIAYKEQKRIDEEVAAEKAGLFKTEMSYREYRNSYPDYKSHSAVTTVKQKRSKCISQSSNQQNPTEGNKGIMRPYESCMESG
jgi:hypothetical protein